MYLVAYQVAATIQSKKCSGSHEGFIEVVLKRFDNLVFSSVIPYLSSLMEDERLRIVADIRNRQLEILES